MGPKIELLRTAGPTTTYLKVKGNYCNDMNDLECSKQCKAHLCTLIKSVWGVKDCKLFHIDFGFILGRDPKPMPPQMKLSKEMVDALGGIHSDNYNIFRQHAVTAFLILRRHGNLFLNLFSLMVDASVPDIAVEPDKTVKKVQDKFRFDLSEEECTSMIHTIIEDSISAVMPAVVEHIHRMAQYWRR